MEYLSANFLIIVAFALGLGFTIGWFARKIGEESRKMAIEAASQEFVNAAHKARDRARQETREVEQRLHDAREEYERAVDTAHKLKTACDELQARVDRRESRVSTLTTSLKRTEVDATDARNDSKALQSRVTALEKQLKEQTRTAESLQVQLVTARKAESDSAAEARTHGERIKLLERRIHDLNGNGNGPTWLLTTPNGHKDDLTVIRGLGPALERNLNKLGIYHFKQLAKATPEDIDWIASRIHAFPGRIKKQNWADQARRLDLRVRKHQS